MWSSPPPSPLTNFRSPPTPDSRVCSVVSIIPDPPPVRILRVRPTTSSILLAVSNCLAYSKREQGLGSESRNAGGGTTATSRKASTKTKTAAAANNGGGAESSDSVPHKRKIPLKNGGGDRPKAVPSVKELVCPSKKSSEKPSSTILEEESAKGRFFASNVFPAVSRQSTSKITIKRPKTPNKKKICLAGCRDELVLSQVAVSAGFELVGENDPWTILWSDNPLPPDKIGHMRRLQHFYSMTSCLGIGKEEARNPQRSNHFPGMYEICKKDRLGRNLNRLRRIFPIDYNFFPETFDLPTEQSDLIAYTRRCYHRHNVTFIIKPDWGCEGKGIYLLKNLRKLTSPLPKCVCQVYLPNPFLIDGYKYDQRIYVLITCVDPLRIYIYDEGIARFATVKYKIPTENNLEMIYMHLTNYSVNKLSESYNLREEDGSKRTLTSVYQWLSRSGYNVPGLIRSIDEIVIKTLLAAWPTLKHNYRISFPNPKRDRSCSCFQLLGFDILLDSQLNPWLLEVNQTPSLNLDLPVDQQVKTGLLRDMFNMVHLGEEICSEAQESFTPPISRRAGNKQKVNSSSGKKLRKKKNKKCNPLAALQFIGSPSAVVISEPLQCQFRHEMKNKGKFRLIYSSDKPGCYQRLCKEGWHLL